MAEQAVPDGQPLQPVPTWPLWVAGVALVSTSVAAAAHVRYGAWLLLSAWVLDGLIVLWRSRLARRLGYVPEDFPPDFHDYGGAGWH